MTAEFKKFGFTYALGDHPALKNINLTFQTGEIVSVCGPSGSGKTTLLRCMKRAISPAGSYEGEFAGPKRESDTAIVFQNPETQLVLPSVINDLAFQMENHGVEPVLMKKRMSETVGYFGLEDILHAKTETLSGGQKQLTSLCAALMCEPKLLLLDEPVSQLDPLAGAAFLEAVRRANADFGVTVVLSEHRLDECAAISDRIVYMEDGAVLFAGKADETIRFLYESGRVPFVPEIPSVSMRIDGRVILTPRGFMQSYKNGNFLKKTGREADGAERKSGKRRDKNKKDAAVSYSEIVFHYPGKPSPVLNRLTINLHGGEIVCLVGGNGCGKSTLLKMIAGINKPYSGRARVNAKKIGYMPQHVRDYFSSDSVRGEMDEANPRFMELASRLKVDGILDKNPFDISGGEQQKVVFLSILLGNPDIIALDEPTKGMDPETKRTFAELLHETDAAVIIATHDIGFAARYAGRCAMLFDGEIAYFGEPRDFFRGSSHYTTALHKAFRHIDETVVLPEDAFGYDG